MNEGIRSNAGRTVMICVDSYENGVPAGRFYNYGRPDEGQPFQSLMQLLVGMEEIMDSAYYPQSYTEKRSFVFSPEVKAEEFLESISRKGAYATFVVRVLFRQHTSWQGIITWQEEKKEIQYRSALELILLMESALSSVSQAA